MEKVIKVSGYTKSGFDTNDVKIMSRVIGDELRTLPDGDVLIFDFSGVKFFTTLFFNSSFTSLLEHMTPEEYERRVRLVNLSDVGQTAYHHSLDYAMRKKSAPEMHLVKERLLAEMLADKHGTKTA